MGSLSGPILYVILVAIFLAIVSMIGVLLAG